MQRFAGILNQLGGWLIPHLERISIELAVLATVVLAAIVLLRIHSPRVRHVFWGLVLAKPLATLLIASPVSLYGWMAPTPPARSLRVVTYSEGPQTGVAARPPNHEMRPVPGLELSRPDGPASRLPLTGAGWLAGIWTAVAVALAVRLAVGFGYVKLLCHSSIRVCDGPIRAVLDEAARMLGVRRPVRIALSRAHHGPVLAGVLRPVILLPEDLPRTLEPDPLRLVLAHELAHVRRWDNLVLLLQRLAEIVFFFHPVVWLCGWAMRREAEAACDDAVIEAGIAYDPHLRESYASSLTCVAEMRCGITRKLLVNTFAAAESHFARRVKRILSGRGGRMTIGVTMVSFGVLVAIACVGLPTAAPIEEGRSRPVDAHDGEKPGSEDNEKGEGRVMNQDAHSDGKQVLLEGVPSLSWGQGQDNTFAGALASATAVTEHPVSYSDIMGLSGLAFRVRWTNEQTATKWCMSCPVGEMPDEDRAFTSLTGWELVTDVQFGVETVDFEGIRRKLVASIDGCRPVCAYGICLDMAVVYGYENNGETLLLTDYHSDERPFLLPLEKMGPMQTYLGKHKEPPPPREALLEALQIAMLNWKRERHHGGIEGREYWYGDAALRAWLHDLAGPGGLSEETRAKFLNLSKWNYGSLKDARAAATTFLREHAPLLGDEGRAALERAADLYAGEVAHLGAWEKRAERPWGASSLAEWDDRRRNSERESLTSVRRTEQRAIAKLEQALRSEGVEPPVPEAYTEPGPSQLVKKVDDYHWKPMWLSHIGCLKAAADVLDVEISVPWLFGVTGYAFLLNVHEELCPSGWHVVDVPVGERLAGTGLSLEYLTKPTHEGNDKAILQKQTWDGLRAAVDGGFPCYGYDLEIGDYYVVYGYDETGYYFSGPNCVDGKGPLPWDDYGVTNMVGVIYMNALKPGERLDDKVVVRDALATAVRQARKPNDPKGLYQHGLEGYEQWVRALENGSTEGIGPKYNAVSYAECRRNAVAFLREAKLRLNDPDLDATFDEAIQHYEIVSQQFELVADAFPMGPPKEEMSLEKRVKTATEALQAAKAGEEKGLETLAALAQALGAENLEE